MAVAVRSFEHFMIFGATSLLFACEGTDSTEALEVI